MPPAAGSPRSIAAAASSIWRTSAWRGVRSPRAAARRCCWHGHGHHRPRAQPGPAAARGARRADGGQLRGGARIAKRQAQQRLLLVGPGEQRRTGCRGQDLACGPDGRQRVADLPAGRPDLRPVEQRQEFEERPALLGYREHSFGETLRGVEVAAFQREAGQRAQMVDGEEVLAESQPLRIGVSGPGHIGRLGQVSGLEPGQRARTRHHHEPDRFGYVGGRQSRGCLALGRREVAQAGIHADEDQRDGGVPFVGELRPVLRCPCGQGLLHGLFQLAGHPVAERLKRREPGGQPRTRPESSRRAQAGQGTQPPRAVSPDNSRWAARPSSRSGVCCQ